MAKPEDGDILSIDDEEVTLRGHLTAEDCATIVTGYDDRLRVVGSPWHTHGRRGFYVNDDDEVCSGGLCVNGRYAGQRGAFPVTVVEVRRG